MSLLSLIIITSTLAVPTMIIGTGTPSNMSSYTTTNIVYDTTNNYINETLDMNLTVVTNTTVQVNTTDTYYNVTYNITNTPTFNNDVINNITQQNFTIEVTPNCTVENVIVNNITQVNATYVINVTGSSDGDTLGDLDCAENETAIFDGVDWVCGEGGKTYYNGTGLLLNESNYFSVDYDWLNATIIEISPAPDMTGVAYNNKNEDWTTFNITANNFFGLLNWSWIENEPNFMTVGDHIDWSLIDSKPTNLSEFTDDLGNRGYTHLSNFTDNLDYSDKNVNSSTYSTNASYSETCGTANSYEETDPLFNEWDKNYSDIINSPSNLTQFTNDLELNNTHYHACENITGATSNLCTLVDTDTDTQDLSYNETTNIISLVDGGSINISEVDTDTNTVYDSDETYINEILEVFSFNFTYATANLKPDTAGTCDIANYINYSQVNNTPTNLSQLTDDLDYSNKNVNSSVHSTNATYSETCGEALAFNETDPLSHHTGENLNITNYNITNNQGTITSANSTCNIFYSPNGLSQLRLCN